MIDNKRLASVLRGQDKQDKAINVNITLDLSSLAKTLQGLAPKSEEYQKIDGLSPSPSG